MQHSLILVLSLAMCELLAFVTPLAADDPPFTQRSSFAKLSELLGKSESHGSAAASCASTACHGGPRPGVTQATAIRGSEYPLWLERDPHAQSYRSLSSELGTRILEQLKILNGGEIIDPPGFNNCLSCHNSTEQALASSVATLRTEGVACDRCHGPSSAWRSTHYTAEWPRIAASPSAIDLGFVNNQDLLTRARMCASCHVGDRERNMNHDMIAAGHPPLLYEFATYHNKLPKHWRDSRSRDAEHYESTLWFVGQIAALEAQAKLIETRAATSVAARSWPEFAHLDCAGCHQPLTGNRPTGQPSSRAGWSRWHRWGVEAVLLQSPNAASDKLRSTINELDKLLESPTADSRAVQVISAKLQDAVRQWVEMPDNQPRLQKFSGSQLRTVLLGVSERSNEGAHYLKLNWESLSQMYLAGVATRGQWPKAGKTTGRATESLPSTASIAQQLRQQLLFSPDKTVPHFQVTPAAPRDAMAFLKALQHSTMHSSLAAPSTLRTEP